MNKNKEFKNFIKNTFEKILENSRINNEWKGKIHYHIDRRETNGDDDIDMGITPCVLGRSFGLHIFKGAFDNYKRGDLNDVVFALCHEAAHLCTSDICKLIDQPYKSRDEVEKEDEMLANKIGSYIQVIYNNTKGKHKCQTKKSNKQRKTKSKRR
jgi:hypothetical protein